MKKLYLLIQLLLVMIVKQSYATDFITTWDLSKAGGGSNNQISFYLDINSTGATYDWETVPASSDFNDVPIPVTSDGNVVISNLPANATIKLTITAPNLRKFKMEGLVDTLRLTDVIQWGTVPWNSMSGAFYGCQNLNITATDLPALGSVTSMSNMFRNCKSLNGPSNIGSWTTTAVTNMSSMFRGATIFNQSIGSWNTENVTLMTAMFRDAAAFNQNIGGWNTAKVTGMSDMFRAAAAFDQNIGTVTWNTGLVTDMSNLFRNASSFDQDISGWNTEKVTTMESMFRAALKFNKNIGSWNTAAVTNMANMFDAAALFNQNLNWTTTSVTTMASMFYGASAFNGDITDWNTSAVTNMSLMFRGAAAFNQDIGDWVTSNVTNMSQMFREAVLFNQDLGGWNTGKVTNMSGMFYTATSFNQNGGTMNWNTALVTNMSEMFRSATAFNTNIGGWTVSAVTNMSNMFRNATAFNQNIGSWTTSAVTNMLEMFRNADAFNQNIGTWNIASATDLSFMFYDADAFNQDIGIWNTAAATNMSNMFYDADAFNQNLGAWSLAATVDLSNMLSNTGMDCAHYSATLMGWADNVNTPSGRSLGATGRTYGTNAAPSRTTLTGKSWTITGDIAGGSPCILSSFPVTLVSFTGKNTNEGMALKWETTSESGASHFEVERSANARAFEKIGRMEALGNSNVLHRYTFLDDLKDYALSVVYYRLRSVDLDESFSVSRVIVLKRTETIPDAMVYPNPAQKSGVVTVELSAQQSEVRLIDMLGREKVVPVIREANGKAEVKLSGVESGLYILKLKSGSTRLIVN